MKKIFSCILAIIILGAMLSGCSNNGSKEMIKKAKNFSIPHEVSINSTKEDYGILAYNFLHYIQDNYPGRIAGTEKEKEMLSARRLTEKCSAFSGDFAIVREEKCKKK